MGSVGAAKKGEAAILDLVLTWHSRFIAASLVLEAALALSRVVSFFWNGTVALSCIRVVALSRNVVVLRLRSYRLLGIQP